jgi:hypothetical protein
MKNQIECDNKTPVYRDKHLLDVTSEQEILPEDYQKKLDKDIGYQEFLNSLDGIPF